MTFTLRRTSGVDELKLTREHERVTNVALDWSSFRLGDFDPTRAREAAADWHTRAFTEFHSLTHFTQLASQLQRLGAPLDWSGAMLRMATDEARHADLCLRVSEALGGPASLEADPEQLMRSEHEHLLDDVRRDVLATFCVAETLSVRMFTRCLQVATVPLAKEAVQAILVDETLHSELGWELGALLMRDVPPSPALGPELLAIFRAVAGQCHALEGRERALTEPEFDEGDNFGTLRNAGYARAFFEGMEADVIPGLEAIGVSEAPELWRQLLTSLPAGR